MSYVIKYYYTSHIGKCRKTNQDNLYCNGNYLNYDNCGTDGIIEGVLSPSSQAVFAVFDGMGGEECGEMAAYLAAKELSEFQFKKDVKQDFADFCKNANTKICNYTDAHKLTSMGTTAALLKFAKDQIGLCNVGDSKIFQFSEGKLQQISYDHVGISAFGKKPPLSQNLGIPESELILSPYVATGEYHNGDIYLICSDGITDMLPVPNIEKILCEEKGSVAAEQLLKQALDNGGKDNITFILIRIEKAKRKFFDFNR